MPKLKAVKPEIDEDEENEVLTAADIEEPEIKEKKAERFFEELPTDREVKISVYKKSAINKTWEQCGKSFFISDNGFDYDSIIDEYGAGHYQFYAHIINDKGRFELYDTCMKRFAEKPRKSENNNVQNINPLDMKKQTIDELRALKELFPPEPKNNDSNMLILKLVDMMQQISDKQTAAQRDSEKRMYETLEKMNAKQGNSKTEFMEMFQLFTEFQQNFSGGQETSTIEKLLPMLAPALPGIVSQLTNSSAPKEIPIIPQKQLPEINIVDNLISKIPDEIKNKLTRENIETVISNSLEKNPHLSKNIMIEVYEKILLSKGL